MGKSKSSALAGKIVVALLLSAFLLPITGILNKLCGARAQVGNFDKSLADAAAYHEKILKSGLTDVQLDRTLMSLGRIYQGMNKFAKAEQTYLRLMTLRKRIYGLNDPGVAEVYQALYGLYLKQGKLAAAEDALKRDLAITEALTGGDSVQVDQLVNTLGYLYNREKKFDQAAACFQRQLKLEQKAVGYDKAKLYAVLYSLANTYYVSKQYAKSEFLKRQWLRIKQEPQEQTDKLYKALFLQNLAILYEQQKNYVECEQLYKKAAVAYERLNGKDAPKAGLCLLKQADALAHLNKFAEAKPLYDRALRILSHAPPAERSWIVKSLTNSAALLKSLEQQEQSELVATTLKQLQN